MPPVTRKRKEVSSTSCSSDDKHSLMNVASTSTTLYKHKCPWKGCEKKFKITSSLRNHYRSHSQVKPYKCTFPSCHQEYSHLSHLIIHICKAHLHQSSAKEEAYQYVEVHNKILTDEAKQLGIKEDTTEAVSGEEMSIDNTNLMLPNLPHFSVIHRSSTGLFICPLSECDQQCRGFIELKTHYRVHGTYWPYKCIFPPSCQFASKQKQPVEYHIRRKHIPPENTNLKPADFIEIRNDWLEMEDALFRNAQIISAPKTEKHCPYACHFANCSKKFPDPTQLRRHLRIHIQTKPFKCRYPDCSHITSFKTSILRHIYVVHFNIPERKLKGISLKKKQKAEKYIYVNQDELDNEKAQFTQLELFKKKKYGKRSSGNLNAFGYESLDYTGENAHLDDETNEDEEDREELLALLAAVQSSTFN